MIIVPVEIIPQPHSFRPRLGNLRDKVSSDFFSRQTTWQHPRVKFYSHHKNSRNIQAVQGRFRPIADAFSLNRRTSLRNYELIPAK